MDLGELSSARVTSTALRPHGRAISMCTALRPHAPPSAPPQPHGSTSSSTAQRLNGSTAQRLNGQYRLAAPAAYLPGLLGPWDSNQAKCSSRSRLHHAAEAATAGRHGGEDRTAPGPMHFRAGRPALVRRHAFASFNTQLPQADQQFSASKQRRAAAYGGC